MKQVYLVHNAIEFKLIPWSNGSYFVSAIYLQIVGKRRIGRRAGEYTK